MKTYLISVSRTESAKNPRPRISFSGGWLYDIGFHPNVLVQVLPAPGGFDFRLCDENIDSYRDLFDSTRAIGGSLTRAFLSNDKGHKPSPTFVVSGQYICSGGLALGDPLIAGYEHGVIRVRKIDPKKLGFENVRIVKASHIRRKYTDEEIPKIFLGGHWMNDIGFKIGAIATACTEPGAITLELQGPDTDYRAFMKYVRGRALKIVQIRKESHNRGEPRPCIGLTGSTVDKAGFGPGDTLAASFEYGTIKFQTLDFEKLGFC